MEVDVSTLNKNMEMIKRDLELIKNILLSEGELTDWAKKELERTRKTPEEHYISLEEVKKKILAKK